MDDSPQYTSSDVMVTPPGQVVRTVIWGKPVFFSVTRPKDAIQRHHLAGMFYEVEELEMIRRRFKPGGVFCDIGANVGNHSIFALLFLHASKVIAFEPNPVAHEVLFANVALNGALDRCDLSHLGIGLSDENESGLEMKYRPGNVGGARMVPRDSVTESEPGLTVIRGDDALRGEPIDFVKIDVEGMELKVLNGLSEVIAANRPTMFIEVDNANREGFDDWLKDNAYKVRGRFRRYRVNENFLIEPRRGTSATKAEQA